MVTPIQLKRSTTSGNVPSSLAAGELAQNLPDEDLFYRSSGGAVSRLSLPESRVMVAKGSVTNAASLTLSIDPAIIGIMRAFICYLTDLRAASDAVWLELRLGDAGGIYASGGYSMGVSYATADNGSYWFTDFGTADTSIAMHDASSSDTSNGGEAGFFVLGTNDPAAAVRNLTLGHFGYEADITTDSPKDGVYGGGRNAIMALTQFRVLYSAGNIATAKYALLGIP